MVSLPVPLPPFDVAGFCRALSKWSKVEQESYKPAAVLLEEEKEWAVGLASVGEACSLLPAAGSVRDKNNRKAARRERGEDEMEWIKEDNSNIEEREEKKKDEKWEENENNWEKKITSEENN